jgi:hypothetical protein
MTSRVPSSLKPSSHKPVELKPVRRSTRPQAAESKPKLMKSGASEDSLSAEAQLWGGADMAHSLEIRASEIEARMAEQGAALQSEKEEANLHSSENAHEAHAQAEKKNPFRFTLFKKILPGQSKPGLERKTAPQEQAAKPTAQAKLSRVETARLLSGEPAKFERPPDAFSLLKSAKEAGTLFVEDSTEDGKTEDGEEPELHEAVEECIRLCFGLTGIHHIGPGRNDAEEAIIVVATMQGFSQGSLSRVPEIVRGFKTLVAIPFELLPLKRIPI